MTRYSLWLLGIALFIWGGDDVRGAERPPNIVFILADDLGWPHLGCYGSNYYETPNIDRLAAQGMRFTDFYAAGAVCSPTRASIQSGQYQARLQITDFIPGHKRPFERLTVPPVADHLPLEIVTPAEALKTAGYATGYFGKWHLGRDDDEGPSRQGYDETVVTGGRHFAPRFRTTPRMEVPDGTYRADFLTDQAIRFISANVDRPFFVQLSHHLVHIPLEAKREMIAKYEAKPKPDGTFHPVYGAMVEHLDQCVGRIMTTLDELAIADKTVLIFTSDNGGLRQSANGGAIVSDNRPLRNEKGSLYEGGIRVPLIVRWPDVTKAVSECHEPTISIDFWPTFTELADAHVAEHQAVDGLSLVPLLRDPAAKLDRDAIYFHYPHYHHSRPAGAIRARDWKLIEFFDTDTVELYQLSEDLSEAHDLAAARPDLAERLGDELRAWRDQVDARMPKPNPDYDPKRAEHQPQ